MFVAETVPLRLHLKAGAGFHVPLSHTNPNLARRTNTATRQDTRCVFFGRDFFLVNGIFLDYLPRASHASLLNGGVNYHISVLMAFEMER